MPSIKQELTCCHVYPFVLGKCSKVNFCKGSLETNYFEIWANSAIDYQANVFVRYNVIVVFPPIAAFQLGLESINELV